MKTAITNGYIIDGSGENGYYGNILIDGKKIKKIGSFTPYAERIIDAKGCVVCPGFIDTHSHSDLKILEHSYNAPKLLQGITTEILGQDGISMAPLPERYINGWRKNLSGLDGESKKINWHYKNTQGYLDYIQERKTCSNVAYLVPHGNIRMEAMGCDNRDPSKAELEKMKEIVRREMDAGAIGLSTGLIYIPCAYSKTEELIELCKVVAEYEGIFVVHQRSEADLILQSMDEIIRIGKESGVKLHFSHFKACGKGTWDLIPQIIEKLDNAKRDGIHLTFDQYPYVAGSTLLSVILPPWVQSGGTEKMLERISNDKIIEQIIEEVERGNSDWDNFIDFAGYDGIYITYTGSDKNSLFIGKSLEEIGKLRNMHPMKAACKLLCEENNAVSMVDFYGKEEHVKLFLSREEQNVCTDGLLSGTPHPRVYGAFPRIIRKYVREEPLLSLEKAVQKMTSKAAYAMGISNRGRLCEGLYADVVIFDKNKIADKGTFSNPTVHPSGINMVMVNGNIVFDGKNKYNNPIGMVLKRGVNI